MYNIIVSLRTKYSFVTLPLISSETYLVERDTDLTLNLIDVSFFNLTYHGAM